jgi:hypothetical protein
MSAEGDVSRTGCEELNAMLYPENILELTCTIDRSSQPLLHSRNPTNESLQLETQFSLCYINKQFIC